MDERDDIQKLINTSREDDLKAIQSILECKNQSIFWSNYKDYPIRTVQQLSLTMFYLALERNSKLVFAALRNLNALHKQHPKEKFIYNKDTLNGLKFDSIADRYSESFLITLYACMESPFNGARQEALQFFSYLITDKDNATYCFQLITERWPWTNKNKYHFLNILLQTYHFYELIEGVIDRKDFLNGLSLSLKYRNLVSPGQSLIVTLEKGDVCEIYQLIGDVLKFSSEFETRNCINHWLPCIKNINRIFNHLHLNEIDILSNDQFKYLQENRMVKLILFRNCFKLLFKSSVKDQIDRLIEEVSDRLDVSISKTAYFNVLITNTINDLNNLPDNLMKMMEFFTENMSQESAPLRQEIFKQFPNFLYFLAKQIKGHNLENDCLVIFFTQLKGLFDLGVQKEEYQSKIFSLRLFEILLKIVYGDRSDRLIKRFSAHKPDELKRFLINREIWDLTSIEYYNFLIKNCLCCDYDDIRDLSCNLLQRFYPHTDQLREECKELVKSSDIDRCSYACYFARILFSRESNCSEILNELYTELVNLSTDYQDPVQQIKSGHHLFGFINCINEYYKSVNLKRTKSTDVDRVIQLNYQITNYLLKLLNNGIDVRDDFGSPSFEKMDESLEILIKNSAYRSTDYPKDKKFILLSIWMTLKACCDLSESLGTFILHASSSSDNYISNIDTCFNVSANVLLYCRHKGAIEAAGLSLGRLVRTLTEHCNENSREFKILYEASSSVFRINGRTNTTRRGAGFSIMIHNLVKNDKHDAKPLLKHIMDILLKYGTSFTTEEHERKNEDNLLASVLHFLCVLVKDAELKPYLTDYMVQAFQIAVQTIQSKEWTVRNASLQLFGAIIPKIVGQTQYFENDDQLDDDELEWEPAYTTYNEIILKMFAIHETIERFVVGKQDHKSALLVTLLELLSRVEIISPTLQIDRYISELKRSFRKFLGDEHEKIRVLSAKCLTRFTTINEIAEFTLDLLEENLFSLTNENLKHGITLSIIFLLKKYDSDIRWIEDKTLFFDVISNRLITHYNNLSIFNTTFYVRSYLIDLFILLKFDIYEQIVLDIMIGKRNVNVFPFTAFYQIDSNQYDFGIHRWKRKMFKFKLG